MAHHAGLKEVKAGEIVNCKVDIAGINDLYPQTMYSFWEIGGEKVANPENVVIFLDHYAPPPPSKPHRRMPSSDSLPASRELTN